VDSWFDSNAGLFAEKEWELNQIRSATPGADPSAEAVSINDATEVIRWYQHQIHVKLRRAIESTRNEKEDAGDGFPKNSDGSAKVALIGLDRSIGAWKMLLSCFPGQQQPILHFVASLESIRRRVESQFPQARAFVRPGFDTML
jgi:hypothetical protein